ncbi:MAG: (2Fe-2S)-binding protein [Planctomycetes bacterium]|nr:(2Fe-2S)-binding protein [Planctomycetota bacterium]
MPDVTLTIDGHSVTVPRGTVVAVALARSGRRAFRRSVTGQERGPLCGMGICGECRVTIDGIPHVRSCQTVCQPAMEVRTDERA